MQTKAGRSLRWYQSLQFKLGLLFALLVALLGAIAFFAGFKLVGNGLVAGNFRYEESVNRRLAVQVELPVAAAESLAAAIAVQMQNHPSRSVLRPIVQQLSDRSPSASLFASIGIWPEPDTLEPGVERASIFLMRDASGRLQPREDYNDARSIPYFREAWYTPVRYSNPRRCFWTLSYRDLLSKRDVVTCSMAIGGTGNFLGTVTVSLDVEDLGKYFAASTADASGYAVLLDRDNHVLALSALAQSAFGNADGNAAQLAQRNLSFNPLALALNDEARKFVDTSVHSAQYDAASISALKDATRDMSRSEAESALSTIWNAIDDGTPERQFPLQDDSVLHGEGYAVLRTLPGTHWRVASVTPAREGDEGSRYLISQALVVTLGSAMLTLALAWGAIRRTVVRPLRGMARELLANGPGMEALSFSLDESARNEVGLLAHWYNQRVEQLRGQIDTVRTVRTELALQTAERLRAQEALARIQERTNLALGSIEDGVIATDENGRIEDMNPVAERLLGSLAAAHGQAFHTVFHARLEESGETPLPDLTRLAIERGARIEYTGGVRLRDSHGEESPIAVVAIPLRSRSGQDVGCIVVFRELRHTLALAAPGLGPATVEAGTERTPHEADRRLAEAPQISGAEEALQLQRVRRGFKEDLFHLTTQAITPSRKLGAEGAVFEILLTLEDEEGFWAPPSSFLPAAGRHGLGAALDRWVLQHTLELLQQRPDIRDSLAFCSVNLTLASLSDPRLLDFLAEQFDLNREIPVSKLCFELPHEAVADHPEHTQKFCEAMRSFGCRVAADYHPGGHSAELDHLRDMPLDFLKLEAHQFPNIVGDPLDQMLGETALRVAHQLNRRVIVNGLDKEPWVDAWRTLGADYFQGYSVARPSPIPFSRG